MRAKFAPLNEGGRLFNSYFAFVTGRLKLNSPNMSCISLAGFCHSPTKDRGQIQVIYGPMFSGKSTELMRRIRRYQIAKRECMVIKYAKDNRYDNECLATHDKQVIPAIKATQLMTIRNVSQFSVIGVDEGQFFSDIVPFCESMANLGKIVIVAALDGTFERKPFATILDLVPLAESVVKLSAVCNICQSEAAFTRRIGKEKEIEVIGGTDKYMAVCRECFTLSQSKIQIFSSPVKNLPFKSGQVRVPLSPLNGSQIIPRKNLF